MFVNFELNFKLNSNQSKHSVQKLNSNSTSIDSGSGLVQFSNQTWTQPKFDISSGL